MIWFACKHCGKTHGRPENSAGTLIFCDCGVGVAVPWESTMPAPAMAEPVGTPAPVPRWTPVPVGEEKTGKPASASPPPPPPLLALPVPRRRQPVKRRDKRFCFNHEEQSSTKTCGACGESFCNDCVIEFQGKTRCGPCKNFEVKLAQKPPRVSGRAVAALSLSLLAAPFAFFPLIASGAAWAVVLCGLTLCPQLLGLGLGFLAVRDTEQNPRVTGRALAITALASSLVMLVLSGYLTILGAKQV